MDTISPRFSRGGGAGPELSGEPAADAAEWSCCWAGRTSSASTTRPG